MKWGGGRERDLPRLYAVVAALVLFPSALMRVRMALCALISCLVRWLQNLHCAPFDIFLAIFSWHLRYPSSSLRVQRSRQNGFCCLKSKAWKGAWRGRERNGGEKWQESIDRRGFVSHVRNEPPTSFSFVVRQRHFCTGTMRGRLSDNTESGRIW